MAHDEDAGSRIVWFLCGFSIGAVVALLYAPRSGRETRRYLSKRADEARDFVSKKADEAREYVRERGEEIYDRGREAVEEASDLLERGRKYVKS